MTTPSLKPLDIVYLKRPDNGIVETAVERVSVADNGRDRLVLVKVLGIAELVPIKHIGRQWMTAQLYKDPYPGAEGLPTVNMEDARKPRKPRK